MDGLLLTRRERLRDYTARTGLVAAPSLVFAVVVLAIGQWVVAVFVVAVAGTAALALGSAVRTRIGAAVVGLLLVGAMVVFLVAAAWLASHPIQRGD
jgi:hypothetical protein